MYFLARVIAAQFGPDVEKETWATLKEGKCSRCCHAANIIPSDSVMKWISNEPGEMKSQ